MPLLTPRSPASPSLRTPLRCTARRPLGHALRRAALALGTALVLPWLAAPAWAVNHALILWIGDYGHAEDNLPGIDLDAANARRMALAMGVPASHITELSNAQLTRANLAGALVGLHQRVKDGERVFIYFSGHGSQIAGRGTDARCTEGLVARDGLFLDGDMQRVLTAIGEKAGQLVMMNDSCFSGGAATRSVGGPEGMKPKFLAPGNKSHSAVSTLGDAYTCGNPTNTTRMTRSLGTLAAQPRGPQVLYIAASNDSQVSFATPRGSLGTLAWTACLQDAAADRDRSGRINGEELRACSQGLIDKFGAKQTITLQGNSELPLSFAQAPSPAAPTPATTPATTPAPAAAPTATAPANTAPGPSPAPAALNAAKVLADLKAGADRALQVALSAPQPRLRVGKDMLEFSVASNREGYLYLLQAGSDGKTFNLLFPNKLDENNFVTAGTHRFPRASWRLRSGGPAGTSHLLAIVSPTKRDLTRGLQQGAVFASGLASASAARTLVVEATGGDGSASRYGASEVLGVVEMPE
jgi:hypothetical protein